MDDDSKFSPDPGDILGVALLYARKGYRVFPCLPSKKEPAIKAWQVAATDDEQEFTAGSPSSRTATWRWP